MWHIYKVSNKSLFLSFQASRVGPEYVPKLAQLCRWVIGIVIAGELLLLLLLVSYCYCYCWWVIVHHVREIYHSIIACALNLTNSAKITEILLKLSSNPIERWHWNCSFQSQSIEKCPTMGRKGGRSIAVVQDSAVHQPTRIPNFCFCYCLTYRAPRLLVTRYSMYGVHNTLKIHYMSSSLFGLKRNSSLRQSLSAKMEHERQNMTFLLWSLVSSKQYNQAISNPCTSEYLSE